ncbi:MAG: chromosomal replication initiator protein DnaA [Clostridia bacterium]|nr:chromosomal replication initiator protein DnaA [Clostridia bacterium]
MESLNEMWNLVCEELKHSLNDVIYNIWFEPMQLISFDGEKVVLSVSRFKKPTIEKQFGDNLRDAFKKVLGFDAEIILEVPQDNPDNTEKDSSSRISVDDEENTFETFVVGSSNKFAFAAAKAVAEEPAFAYNPLFIYGSSGLGKTHLLCAIKNAILERNPDANVVFTRGEDFVNLIVSGIQKGAMYMNSIHDKFRNCDVLLVDDIQFIAGKEQTQEEFFHTFNALKSEGKQIVLISDSMPKDIALLEDRLRTRFEMGLLADIQPPDFETRMAIIQRKASHLGLELPQDVTEYLAEKVKNNIRQLEGAVKKIHALVNLEGSPINVAMAQSAIKDLAGEGLPTSELVKKIISEAARTFAITQEDITSKKKDSKTVKARQIAIYAIRECTELTQQEISEYFGGRDRTAIHYAIEKTAPMIERDPNLRRTVENIIKNAKEQ